MALYRVPSSSHLTSSLELMAAAWLHVLVVPRAVGQNGLYLRLRSSLKIEAKLVLAGRLLAGDPL